MKDIYIKKADILKALGHPTRLRIVEGLLNDECNVNHIVECLDMPQSTISQHLAVLKSAGILEGERRGTEICYKVVNGDVKKIIKLML
ncbi:MAG: metalloregulator ArsR/SmtB family transcription factor [Armatimonadota bacterium]